MIVKHFVTFVSPGTFVPETTTKPIDSWDIDTAVEMSRGITERHAAKPYCFHFTTRTNDGNLDSKESARSCNYFLGGKVFTREQIEERNDPTEGILRSNMRCNDIQRVIINGNSWKSVLPLGENDVVLEYAC